MLDTLRIKNVALVSEIEVLYGAGLNVLSGETGAGKSIVIDALGFVLGGRVGKDFIKSGAESALVEAVISVDTDWAAGALAELGVEVDADKAIFISRSVKADGKSASRINGRTVTGGLLKEVGAVLVDIHSQHQHQSLLDANRHIVLLDRFCGNDMGGMKARLSEVCQAYREAKRAIEQIAANSADLTAKIELYAYQAEEIEDAKLSPDEEDELLERRRLLNAAEKLAEAGRKVLSLLYDGNGSVLDKLSTARERLADMAEYESRAAEFSTVIDSTYADIDDMVRDFRRFAENLPQDNADLDRLEERLDVIYRLKRKYNRDIPGLIEFGAVARQKLDALLNSGEDLERLKKELETHRALALDLCAKISEARRAAAVRISADIAASLADLGMKDARFDISVLNRGEFGPEGFDKVEFLISANPGESLKPLAKIASGGEMSRVMLALKTALAAYDCIETFIFDEIDTGVSGRTAQMVAEKLCTLAKTHQILCVTHLPQIAAMADQNFLISKTATATATTTHITPLDRPAIIHELARLTSGAEITEVSLAAADEMKRLADERKVKR